MLSNIRLWVSAIGAFAVTVGAVLALRPIAYAVDLLDRPGGHKTHHGTVPVVGGLGMLLGLIFGLSAQAGALGELQPYVFSAVLLAVVGMLDDRFNLTPRIRLAVQFAAVLPMFFGASVRLLSFGDLFGFGPISVAGVSLLPTAIVAIAAINAFNMLDGLDGLAGGVALVATVVMLALTSPAAHGTTYLLLAVLGGSISGFLVFNVPVRWNRRVRCFMGDAGSTLLGFTMAWLMIGLSQGPERVASPVTMVWLVAVPSADLVWSVIRRLSRGHSPMHPDNEHLHHMLLRGGLGVRAVFVLMLILAVVCASFGVVLERSHVPEWASFALLTLSGAGLVLLGRSAPAVAAFVPERLLRRH